MAAHTEKERVSPEELTPGTEVNGWRILERLGTGGFGAAYRVEALTQPGTFFALKMAKHRGDERVGREIALLMTRALHPHVVRLHACGRWPHPATGYLYFVMDWVPGPPIHLWAEAYNPSIRLTMEKLATVAVALEHLHTEGVFHRDLKPDHILVREPDGKPLLIDFGVGWYAGADTLTTQGMAPGTPHLRSPEAVRFWREHSGQRGARYDYTPSDDVYALGVSAYRVLTGHWPFGPHLERDLLFGAIESLEPPEPREVNHRLPRAISDVLLRMVAKRPQDRYGSCAEVHAALVAALTFSDAEALDAPLFDWEEGAVEGAPRRVRMPEWPTAPKASTVARRGLLPMLAERFRQGDSVWAERSTAVAASPGAGTTERTRRRARARAVWLMGVVALVGLGGLGALAAWPPPPQTQPTQQVGEESSSPTGQKVDPEPERPESARAAVPPRADPTPAVVAPATNPQDVPPVKTKNPTTAQKTDPKVSEPRAEKPQSKVRPNGSTLASVAAAACLAAACASTPQVQPFPPPPDEPCPEGSSQGMTQAGLQGMIDVRPIDQPKARGVLTLREEDNAIWVTVDRTNSGTQLLGSTYVRDRFYARFTRALTKDGRHFPVCLELREAASHAISAGSLEGVYLAEPSNEPGTARVESDFLAVVRTHVFGEDRD